MSCNNLEHDVLSVYSYNGQNIQEIICQIDSEIDQLKNSGQIIDPATITKILERLKALEDKLDGFKPDESLSRRLSVVEGRIGSIDNRMQQLEGELALLERHLREQYQTVVDNKRDIETKLEKVKQELLKKIQEIVIPPDGSATVAQLKLQVEALQTKTDLTNDQLAYASKLLFTLTDLLNGNKHADAGDVGCP